MDTTTLPCAVTTPRQRHALRNLPEAMLWRVAERFSGELSQAALAELERRELETAREKYFSRAVPTTPTAVRDLKPGNVITSDRGVVRMVVRDVFQLRGSDRVLVTVSYSSVVTGEIYSEVKELPVMTGDTAVRLVRETAPDFSALAVTR